MANRQQSYFVVIDGVDGAGKEVIVTTVRDYFRNASSQKKHVLDLNHYWKNNHRHPQFKRHYSDKDGTIQDDYLSLDDFDIVTSSEPTYTGIGQILRNNIITNHGDYSAHTTAQQFATDRLVLYTELLIPSLKAGKIWIQSRSFSTSIVYQKLQATTLKETLTVDEILAFDGNQLALKNPPNLLLIATVKDVQKALERTKRRDKEDRTFFEKLEFQKKLAAEYESPQLKNFFERLGTNVAYVPDVETETELEQKKQNVIDILDATYSA